MLKRGLLLVVLSLSTLAGLSQTDSTDIILSTTTPTLATELDSILFSDGNFSDYLIEFDITDTANFGTVSIELALPNNQILFRHEYTLTELQTASLIDANWQVNINFGTYDANQNYKVNVVIGDSAGVLSPSICKNY